MAASRARSRPACGGRHTRFIRSGGTCRAPARSGASMPCPEAIFAALSHAQGLLGTFESVMVTALRLPAAACADGVVRCPVVIGRVC
jgi:hypothetical protein